MQGRLLPMVVGVSIYNLIFAIFNLIFPEPLSPNP